MSEDLYLVDLGGYSGPEHLKVTQEANMSEDTSVHPDDIFRRNHWLVIVDEKDSKTTVYDGRDFYKLCRVIGQMVVDTGIEVITVYRNSEEYRRYELKRKEAGYD